MTNTLALRPRSRGDLSYFHIQRLPFQGSCQPQAD